MRFERLARRGGAIAAFVAHRAVDRAEKAGALRH